MPTLQRAEQQQLRRQIPRTHDRAKHLLTRAAVAPSGAQLRADTDTGDSIGFKGEAIVFNTPAWIGSKRWGFWEQIAPEAVVETIANDDIRMLKNHNPDLLLARTTNDTLRLDAQDNALAVDADMAPTTYARDLAILLERQDLTQMSFAFEDIEWTYTEAEDGNPLYTLTKIRMFDVAPVTYPAYEDTTAGLRGIDVDELLRSAGVDPVDLLRSIAQGEDLDPDIAAALRSSAPLLTAPASTEARTEPPAETSSGESTPRSDELNPGDHLRDLSWEHHSRANKEGTR